MIKKTQRREDITDAEIITESSVGNGEKAVPEFEGIVVKKEVEEISIEVLRFNPEALERDRDQLCAAFGIDTSVDPLLYAAIAGPCALELMGAPIERWTYLESVTLA